jgi:hypothetical protein
VYTIDLAKILQILREFRRNGILQAELPAGLPRLKQPCQIVIELVGGEVASAFVKNTKGQTLLVNDEALQAVAAVGKLTWVFDQLPSSPSAPPPFAASVTPVPPVIPALPAPRTPQTRPLQDPFTQPQMLAFPRSPIPRRLMYLSQEEIARWPVRHRQVFVLIDGQRNREKIAAVLGLPIPLVSGVLQELQSLGIIEFKPF